MLRWRLGVALGLCLALGLGAAGCAGSPLFAPAPRPELPADYPDDLPPYPGGTLTDARKLPEGAISASWETSDRPDAIWRFYRDDLRARGWSPVREKRDKTAPRRRTSSAPPASAADGAGPPELEQRLIVAQKGSRSATFLLLSDGTTTSIDLMLMNEEPR